MAGGSSTLVANSRGAGAGTSGIADDGGVAGLVSRARRGDQGAWNAIVDRFAGLVWAVARAHRLDNATAADVSQVTWLRLVEHLDDIKEPGRIGAWLATTARRESLRLIRSASRQVPTGEQFDLVPAPASDQPDRRLLTEDRDELLATLIGQLPCRCQLLLRLLTADDRLSYNEVGDALDMPIGSIGPTRARCLDHLRRVAKQAGLDLDAALL